MIIVIVLSSITYYQLDPLNSELSEIMKDEPVVLKKGTIIYRSDYEPFPYGLAEYYSINTETGSIIYCLTGDILNRGLIGKHVEIEVKQIENYKELIYGSQLGLSPPGYGPFCDDVLLLVESIKVQ